MFKYYDKPDILVKLTVSLFNLSFALHLLSFLFCLQYCNGGDLADYLHSK